MENYERRINLCAGKCRITVNSMPTNLIKKKKKKLIQNLMMIKISEQTNKKYI